MTMLSNTMESPRKDVDAMRLQLDDRQNKIQALQGHIKDLETLLQEAQSISEMMMAKASESETLAASVKERDATISSLQAELSQAKFTGHVDGEVETLRSVVKDLQAAESNRAQASANEIEMFKKRLDLSETSYHMASQQAKEW
jgi:tRNA A22 N-methylase